MEVVYKSKRHVWLLLLFLVIGSNVMLYHSDVGVDILQSASSGVVVGSLIDLVIVSPILFLVWKRQKSIKLFVVLMASGLVVSRFLIPMNYLEPFVAITWVGFAIEALLVFFELLLIVALVQYMPKIVREVKSNTSPLIFAFPNAVNHYVKKQPFIQVICSEMLMFYYACASWKKKQAENDHSITLHQKSSYIALQMMLIHAIVIETIGIHWWLHEKSVILSIILLLLNVYTLLLIVADIQAVRLNPMQLEEDRFYISLGLMKRMEIRWDDIEEIIIDQTILEQKLTKDTIDFIARDFEQVFPHVILVLKQSKEATLFMGIKKPFKKVAIRCDEPEKFITQLKRYVGV